MMKGIIISHENGGSYVLDRSGCFHFVRGYASQPVGTEIELQAPIKVHYGKMAAMAACVILAVALSCLSWFWNTESYSVYVDANPSVELVFNNFNRLKNAKPLNDEGTVLLSGMNLTGSPESTVLELIEAAEREGYVSSQSDMPEIIITVMARNGKAPERYTDAIAEALNKNQIRELADIDVCDRVFLDEAERLGVSPGRLRLAKRLFASDPSRSLDEIIKLAVRDLIQEVNKAEHKTIAPFGDEITDPTATGSDDNNAGGNSGTPSELQNTNAVSGDNPDGNVGASSESLDPAIDSVDNSSRSGNNNSSSGNPNAGPGNNNSSNSGNPNAGPGNNNAGGGNK